MLNLMKQTISPIHPLRYHGTHNLCNKHAQTKSPVNLLSSSVAINLQDLPCQSRLLRSNSVRTCIVCETEWLPLHYSSLIPFVTVLGAGRAQKVAARGECLVFRIGKIFGSQISGARGNWRLTIRTERFENLWPTVRVKKNTVNATWAYSKRTNSQYSFTIIM